ncbi:hypothetical protein MMC18_002095 [Xylographa bjoerkii]|nr:hypothetical protein [Xylographa bjoerkii]
MSGTTPRNDTNAVDSSSTASMKKASSDWRNFEDALKSISEHSWVFSNITEAMDRHSTTELDAQKKNEKIAEQESGIKALMDQHEKRWSDWDKDKSQLVEQVKIVQSNLTKQAQIASKKQAASYAQDIEKLKRDLDIEKTTVATLKKELKEARAKTQKIEADLVQYTVQMREWEGLVSSLQIVDYVSFDDKVGQLFTHCRSIVRRYFSRDLPAEFFADEAQWDDRSSSLRLPLSFPPSNTPAAKCVRMAASLHVIAGQLCTNIFKPCYILESGEVSDAIMDILTQQFMDNTRKERVTRALLLSTFDPEDIKVATKQAASDASKKVLALLSWIGGNEDFRKDMEKFFLDAAELWTEAQHSTKMVEASMKDDLQNWTWRHLEEFTSAAADTKAQQALQPFNMLSLFPRVYVPEDKHIVFSGFVLWGDQSIVSAAEHELRGCIAARRSTGGWNGNSSGGSMRRDRRLSTLADRWNGVTALSPSSLKTEIKAPFLEQRPQTQGSRVQNGHGGKG